ncbi:hypothetical protein K7472_31305 [Streptomyces sp. PTM05]|uniref:Uncharacterized protein n=1 Tax=Streptantibioticus parmotrematis TaxID=2873249 RepID=A0ABS7R1F5_9ACTN|nr:hypothetical protein [Streptantibioticus parmotrematis]MBY8889296.1 hypothetical protein [Streptantibioticus parmotrematis]
MSPTIDELLADIRLPATGPAPDAAAGLRRLSAAAARRRDAGHDLDRARQAGHTLTRICHRILADPQAAGAVAALARHPGTPQDNDDVEGALTYGCLLHLTGHPESAQFWWQLAAGATCHITAAYCLHLHHLQRGELREAELWNGQAARFAAEPDDMVPLPYLSDLLATLAARPGGREVPTEALEDEVTRLEETGLKTEDGGPAETCGIVPLPDQQLADRLLACTGPS